MFKVQRHSKVSLLVTLDEFQKWGGLDDRSLRTARKELEQKRLITSERRPNGYSYSILSPSTGKPWITSTKAVGTSLDFRTLTEDQTASYYQHRLKNLAVQDTNGLKAACPFHGQSGNTLSITLAKGSAWKCFSCGLKGTLIDFEVELGVVNGEDVSRSEARERVVAVLRHTGAIDAATGELEALYRYEDEDGRLLYEKVRYPGKDFIFRRPDPSDGSKHVYNIAGVRRVLYRLPQVLRSDVIIILEGEKDVDRVSPILFGDVAVTTAPFGAGQWDAQFTQTLKGKKVIIVPDNDEAGMLHCRVVCRALEGVASEVIVRTLPDGFKDASELLNVHPSRASFISFLNTDWIDQPTII
jgi:5S rRNA maturation endonuclease (ribonuclease M5)